MASRDTDPVKEGRPAWLADFFPGYFSLSMATGIIAIDSHVLHHDGIDWILFVVNVIAYPTLWCITAARVFRFPGFVLADFRTHELGPTFLTMVAATGLIGSQCATFGIAISLLPWILGLALMLWIGLMYGFLATTTLGSAKPDLEHGLNGSWFLLIVGTESVAILGSIVSRDVSHSPLIGFFALAACLLGGVLYLMMLGLVFYRWTFIPMSSAEMTESWWINMGAAAITTLAGAELLRSPLSHQLRSFLDPFTVLFWAVATFWIPLLAIIFFRKYVIEWHNLRYRPGVWSLVFPLGMYSVATQTYASASGTGFLHPVARSLYWVALASWILSMIGLLNTIRTVSRSD